VQRCNRLRHPLPFGVSRSQLLTLQFDDLAGIRQSSFGLPQHALQLRPRHLGIRQFLPLLLKLRAQFGRRALRFTHRRLEGVRRDLEISGG